MGIYKAKGLTPGSPWSLKRKHPVDGIVKAHEGQDFKSGGGGQSICGKPIYAAADGEIIDSAWHNGYGNTVIVEHTIDGKTVQTLYGHMQSPSSLKKGDSVLQGQEIGKVGNTGVGTGCHLHFEVLPGGKSGTYAFDGTVDPKDFVFPERIARVTDPTTTGNPITLGSDTLWVEGLRASRVGDTVPCPTCKKVGIITTGCESVLLDGRNVAIVGSLVVCGCPSPSTLETTQHSVSSDGHYSSSPFPIEIPDLLKESIDKVFSEKLTT